MAKQVHPTEEDARKPPVFGDITTVLLIAPASQQSSRAQKRLVTDAVKGFTEPLAYLLTGDVQIEVEWRVAERTRYESDVSPDVDNVLKPMIDALGGSDGIVIDDCQVQAVTCYWVDIGEEQQSLCMTVRFQPDEWLPKEGLTFIDMGKGLCMPITTAYGPSFALKCIDTYQQMMATREALLEATGSYYLSLAAMPIQRVFHRSRLRGFPIVSPEDLRRGLQELVPPE